VTTDPNLIKKLIEYENLLLAKFDELENCRDRQDILNKEIVTLYDKVRSIRLRIKWESTKLKFKNFYRRIITWRN
jgi:hypothetical protein